MSITAEYAAFCASHRYEDIPDAVRERTKHLVLDTLGIAIGGRRAASTDSLVSGTRRLNRDAGGATVLATGEEMGPEYAALLNGAMAHSLDFDDTHRASSLHPGAPVMPAALAAGEAVDATGRDLLTAIVTGYEVTIRLGMALDPSAHYARGFHGTATCGLFGATAAAGSLYGFDAATFERAFGLNGSQAAGSLQFLENGAWNKRAHPGLAAHRALLSTAYAETGFRAATEPIEGGRGFLQGYSDDPAPGKATAGLGETYELENVAIKPYPCCRYMHAPLDALFDLVDRHDIDHAAVERVDVEMASPGIELTGDPTNRYPQTVVDCQFSMPFGAALALVHRDDSVDAFLEAAEGGVSEPLKRIIDLTTVSEADWIEAAYPEQWPAAVTVETTEGTYTARTEYARGEPENPLSWEDLVGKYEQLTEPVLGTDAAVAFRRAVDDLDAITVQDLVAPVAE